MKTFLVVLFLVIASMAYAEPFEEIDDRVDMSEYDLHDEFRQEGLLWFPLDRVWANSISRCECIKNSVVTGRCISLRCWTVIMQEEGKIKKIFHLYGAK